MEFLFGNVHFCIHRQKKPVAIATAGMAAATVAPP
jgi:hypothetical protein